MISPDPFQLVTDHTKSTVTHFDIRRLPDSGLELKYPAVEKLQEFVKALPNETFGECCRTYNASICRGPDGGLVAAVRVERWNAMNVLCLVRLTERLEPVPTRTMHGWQTAVELDFPDDGVKGAHWEDPRLAVVAGQLLLICAWVKFGTPTICRQRLWRLDPATFAVLGEIELPYGRSAEGHPEKNWMPFETPEGSLAILYQQRPWTVIENPSHQGHETPGLVGWKMPGKYLSGRTPPVKLPGGHLYLSFFGGHVKHEYRGARYFMGALVFSTDRPYGVVMATPEPLVWGSECSPTLLSARPASGHPICIYPSGAVVRGEEVVVSCGVNDSYNVFLSYRLTDLISRMVPVNKEGQFA